MADSDHEKTSVPPWIILLLALAGGGGTSALFQAGSDPRPDPWTGSDDREAMAQLLRYVDNRFTHKVDRLENLERQLQAVIAGWTNHEVEASQWKARIEANSTKIENLERGR